MTQETTLSGQEPVGEKSKELPFGVSLREKILREFDALSKEKQVECIHYAWDAVEATSDYVNGNLEIPQRHL